MRDEEASIGIGIEEGGRREGAFDHRKMKSVFVTLSYTVLSSGLIGRNFSQEGSYYIKRWNSCLKKLSRPVLLPPSLNWPLFFLSF